MTDRAPVVPRLSETHVRDRLAYDRAAVTPGIVHLGLGAFCRAHLAVHIDAILAGEPAWGIIGASLRSGETRTALAPQDFLYTLGVRNGAATATRVIGSVLDVLDAHSQRRDLIEAMADPRIRIVSLTVTEKGYCRNAATGALEAECPEIVHDLANPEMPVTAPGLILRALELRRARGVAPFTVLSCDNLPGNGVATRRVVVDLAGLRSKALAEHIAREVAFPSTMVDRIVPATTEADRAAMRALTGLDDAWPVVTEPFTQWVVEDVFPAGRPNLAAAGVQLVADVHPYELMKLRMLNGSHSTLAYAGYLAGHEYVSDAIADPVFRRLVFGLMTEDAMPTLPQPASDLAAYRDALLVRFGNPALRHRTWQIAMDGSQKLPQRLLGTVRDGLRQGRLPRRATFGVAAWIRYASGRDERGRPIDVRDPLAARFTEIGTAAQGSEQRLVDGFLQVREIFGNDLASCAPFLDLLVGYVGSLFARGARATAEDTT